ncbi:pollen Ole e 1 allergen/extensin family protein, partial [Acinetobacter baumannii]
KTKKTKKMSKALLILFAVCVLPALASARFVSSPFKVVGPVYCDTCRCGYETEATKYLAGATVRIECRNGKTAEVTYTKSGVTDATGKYEILVNTDRGDEICDVVLVKSSDPQCAQANAGRDRARIILTRNNGMTSDTRFANAMGFLANTPLASCTEILKKYQETEEDI